MIFQFFILLFIVGCTSESTENATSPKQQVDRNVVDPSGEVDGVSDRERDPKEHIPSIDELPKRPDVIVFEDQAFILKSTNATKRFHDDSGDVQDQWNDTTKESYQAEFGFSIFSPVLARFMHPDSSFSMKSLGLGDIITHKTNQQSIQSTVLVKNPNYFIGSDDDRVKNPLDFQAVFSHRSSVRDLVAFCASFDNPYTISKVEDRNACLSIMGPGPEFAKQQEIHVWSPICPEGYKSVGDFITNTSDKPYEAQDLEALPAGSYIEQTTCVNERYLVPAQPDEVLVHLKIQTGQDLLIFKLTSDNGLNNTGLFKVFHGDSKDLANTKYYSINRESIISQQEDSP